MATTASRQQEPTLPQPDAHRLRSRLPLDRLRLASALSGSALLGGLALALGGRHVLAVAVTAAGVISATVVLAPVGWRAAVRHRGALVLALIGAWLLVMLVAGLAAVGASGSATVVGLCVSWTDVGLVHEVVNRSGWPWKFLGVGLLPILITLLIVTGGVVLIADAVRAGLGTDSTPRPWRLMTAAPTRRARVTGSALSGVALIILAALIVIEFLDRFARGHPLLEGLVLLAVGGGAAVVTGSPILVGLLTRVDRDQAGRAREEERQRFAAHLHDSVLQTLALVQRQAHDPAVVARLARRQEHALRAWMAGESELVSETLAAAIREVVASVEDEYGVSIECTAIGDRPLDREGEALTGAAREALRNAARHAAGAPVIVFCEISAGGAAVFVRDQGSGFDPAAVARERRGIRDAIIGRMAAAGGRGNVDSATGQGTEVTLAIGDQTGGI